MYSTYHHGARLHSMSFAKRKVIAGRSTRKRAKAERAERSPELDMGAFPSFVARHAFIAGGGDGKLAPTLECVDRVAAYVAAHSKPVAAR